MYKLHTQCRACGNTLIQPSGIKSHKPPSTLVSVCNLGPMPLVNDFKGEDDEREGYAPLRVMYCTRCTLAQLSVTVKPEVLYANYPYITGDSDTMRRHFEALKTDMLAQQGGSLGNVLEIGSNNGALLKYLRPSATGVCGVDPAENLAKEANDSGIPTFAHVWNHFAAAHALAKMGTVDTIIARHVFCHIDNWREAIDAIDSVCNDRTLVAIEAPWVMDLLDGNQWDTIYHEHLSYMSVGALDFMLKGTNLRLVDVRRYAVHGGSLVLYLRHKDAGAARESSVDHYKGVEFARLSEDRWKRLETDQRAMVDTLKSYVRGLREQGKRVVGYGASAKATNWIAACGFDRGLLEAVYDCTPQKWYKTVPGTNIPVLHSGQFYADAADYAVMFCWNFAADVYRKEAKWLAGGGKFVVPVPELRCVGKDEAEALSK